MSLLSILKTQTSAQTGMNTFYYKLVVHFLKVCAFYLHVYKEFQSVKVLHSLFKENYYVEQVALCNVTYIKIGFYSIVHFGLFTAEKSGLSARWSCSCTMYLLYI